MSRDLLTAKSLKIQRSTSPLSLDLCFNHPNISLKGIDDLAKLDSLSINVIQAFLVLFFVTNHHSSMQCILINHFLFKGNRHNSNTNNHDAHFLLAKKGTVEVVIYSGRLYFANSRVIRDEKKLKKITKDLKELKIVCSLINKSNKLQMLMQDMNTIKLDTRLQIPIISIIV